MTYEKSDREGSSSAGPTLTVLCVYCVRLLLTFCTSVQRNQLARPISQFGAQSV